MPLVGENRVIAKLGLQMLSKGPHKVGLRALLDVAGLTGKQIDSYHIAFMMAPRINAAGRMSTPDIATRLLLAADEGMADEARGARRAARNREHAPPQEEQDIVAKARKIIETDPEVGARSILVVAGEGWHRGVIGIVASKIVDTFYRPTIVLSIEDGIAHGSCRSIPGLRHAGRARIVRADAAALRRPQAGRGAAARSGAHQGVPPGDQRVGRRRGFGPTICGRACGSTAR